MKRVLSVSLVAALMLMLFTGAHAQTTEERIAALEDRVMELEHAIRILLPEEDEQGNDSNESVRANDEPASDAVLMQVSDFLKDIVDSYNTRAVIATRYSNSELNSMTYAELASHRVECAESERPFYEKYRHAVFEDLNIQYLCAQYIQGLEKQYQSKDVWEKYEDYDKFNDIYNSGYYNRAYVIVELAEYYHAAFGDIASMKADVQALDATNEAEKRNSQVARDLVLKTQQGLNDIGFFCGTVDGVAGKRTVKSIKRFQEMYGYVVDGMIDEELVDQLNKALADR